MPAIDNLVAEYHASRQELAETILIPRILEGDQPAIRSLLLILAEAMDDSAPINSSLSAYLGPILREIAEGRDPKKAFGLSRKRGEKDLHEIHGEMFKRAYRVEYLRHQGKSLEEAIAQVSLKHDLPEDTVKGAWKRHHQEAKRQLRLNESSLGRVIDI